MNGNRRTVTIIQATLQDVQRSGPLRQAVPIQQRFSLVRPDQRRVLEGAGRSTRSPFGYRN